MTEEEMAQRAQQIKEEEGVSLMEGIFMVLDEEDES